MKSKLLKKLRRRFKLLSHIEIDYPYAKISVIISFERKYYDSYMETFRSSNTYVKFRDYNSLIRKIKDAEHCYLHSKIKRIRSKRESERIKKLLKSQL